MLGMSLDVNVLATESRAHGRMHGLMVHHWARLRREPPPWNHPGIEATGGTADTAAAVQD